MISHTNIYIMISWPLADDTYSIFCLQQTLLYRHQFTFVQGKGNLMYIVTRLLVIYYQDFCCNVYLWYFFFLFSAIFIPDPKDGSLYAFGSAHDGLKVLAFLDNGYIVSK